MTVSVIIPLYNKANYVKKSIDSALAQTYDDFEIVVVDDGSTDNSADIVESYASSKIKVIKKKNGGVASARNTGIKSARAEWIAFLDADDEWMPNKLENQIRILSNNQNVVWGASGFLLCNQKRAVKIHNMRSSLINKTGVISDALVPLSKGYKLWTGTIIVKRNILEKIGGFDESLITGEDIDLWMRLAVNYPQIVFVNQPLVKYNIGIGESLTASGVSLTNLDSVALLPRRAIELSKTMADDRAAYMIGFAKKLVCIRVNTLIERKQFDMAQKLLEETKELNFGFMGLLLKLKVKFPIFMTIEKTLLKLFRIGSLFMSGIKKFVCLSIYLSIYLFNKIHLFVSPVGYARKIGVQVGDNCRLINVTFGSEPYLVKLGNHVSITDSTFITHDGSVWVFRQERPNIDLFGHIVVGNNVFIGAKCIILPGVTIGDNVIIGAGAVVTKNIPSNCVAAGVPAKVIKTLDEYRDKIGPMLFETKKMNKSQKKNFLLNKNNWQRNYS